MPKFPRGPKLKKDLKFCFSGLLFIYLFVFGFTGSSLLHTGFLLLQQVGTTLYCAVGFSLWWLVLWSMGFSVHKL